jgi:hypothetical protein
MLATVRTRLTYANLMATFAVFIALGGSSYAALTITGKNVKDNSLTTKDIKNKSLLKKDFKSGQLPAGARGATGQSGASGANGRDGSAGTARAYGLVSGAGVLDPAVRKNATVTKTSTGLYCIKLDPSIDDSTTAASATLAFGSGVDAKLRSIDKHSAGTCDLEPHAVAVQTFTYSDTGVTTSVDEPFFFLVP